VNPVYQLSHEKEKTNANGCDYKLAKEQSYSMHEIRVINRIP
jgi:hypothetical protein